MVWARENQRIEADMLHARCDSARTRNWLGNLVHGFGGATSAAAESIPLLKRLHAISV